MTFPAQQFVKRKKTDYIVIHCSMTGAEQDVDAKEIGRWHVQRGFLCIGYHFVIKRNGNVEEGRHVDAVGAHVQDYNHNSIGICMVGGGKVKEENNFTDAQWSSLEALVAAMKHEYTNAKVQGHRDFPNVAKFCPSFDVKAWVKEKGI